MRIRLLLAVAAVLLLVPSAVFASVAGEQRQGARLLTDLRSGATSCGDLSPEDFDHIGEYVMGRALGSVSAHGAMNDRMRLMLGDQGEQRMHELMGQRFSGCASRAGGGYGPMMGGGMMGGAHSGADLGQMMRSSDWSWMMGGTWRHMDRRDWQRLQDEWATGGGTMSHHRWSAWAIAAVALGAVLLVGLAIIALTRRPFTVVGPQGPRQGA